MTRRGLLIATVITTGMPTAVHACGACVEDKVAATYDHAVIHAAIAKRQQVVFVTVDGAVDVTKIGARIAAAAPKVHGVVAGTLRTYAAGCAESSRNELAVASFRKAVGDPSTRLTMVRIIRNGSLIEPP